MQYLFTKEQKKNICMLARKAWLMQTDETKNFFLNAGGGLLPTEAFNLFRRTQQEQAVGKSSLTKCGNNAYCTLMAHFAKLARDNRLWNYWQKKAISDEKRRLLYLIQKTCSKVSTMPYPIYVNSICKAQYKCNLYEASVKQLQNLLVIVKNRLFSHSRSLN